MKCKKFCNIAVGGGLKHATNYTSNKLANLRKNDVKAFISHLYSIKTMYKGQIYELLNLWDDAKISFPVAKKLKIKYTANYFKSNNNTNGQVFENSVTDFC